MIISMVVLNTFTHDSRVMKEAQTLQSHGYQIFINALWAPGLPYQEIIHEGIHVYRYPQWARYKLRIPLFPWFELLVRITHALIKQKPIICHAHDLNGLMAAYIGSRLTKAKLIYDSHEFEIGRSLNKNLDNWKVIGKRWIEKYLIRRVDRVFTVSNSIATELTHLYQIPRPVVIHNCPLRFDPPSKGRLRNEAGWSDKSLIIIHQGGLFIGLGIEALIQAVSMVPKLHLAIIGEGPLSVQISTLAKHFGISDRIFMRSMVPLSLLLEYTCDADIGACLIENICLSYYYSLPNKLFEYLMAGAPGLVSNFPDMRKVIEDANAGLSTDPSDPQAIASALRQMLADPEALNQMAHNARQVALEKYNWENESQSLLKVYSQLDITNTR